MSDNSAPTHKAEPTEPMALTIRQFCKHFNVSRSSLYVYAKQGRVRIVRVCGRTLVPMSEALRLLNGEC